VASLHTGVDDDSDFIKLSRRGAGSGVVSNQEITPAGGVREVVDREGMMMESGRAHDRTGRKIGAKTIEGIGGFRLGGYTPAKAKHGGE